MPLKRLEPYDAIFTVYIWEPNGQIEGSVDMGHASIYIQWNSYGQEKSDYLSFWRICPRFSGELSIKPRPTELTSFEEDKKRRGFPDQICYFGPVKKMLSGDIETFLQTIKDEVKASAALWQSVRENPAAFVENIEEEYHQNNIMTYRIANAGTEDPIYQKCRYYNCSGFVEMIMDGITNSLKFNKEKNYASTPIALMQNLLNEGAIPLKKDSRGAHNESRSVTTHDRRSRL